MVLHKEVVPSKYNDGNTFYVGRLQSFQGEQSYELPEGLDINQYKAVIIYCKKYNVTFASSQIMQL